MKKFTLLFSLLLTCLLGAKAQIVITDAANLVDGTIYTLQLTQHTNHPGVFLTSSSSQITTNKNASEFKPWETANQFMFKTVNNSVYLYSVSQAKYLKDNNTWQAEASNASALTISTGTAQTNTLFFQIGSNYINANGEGNITISGWKTHDKGNNFTVTAWTETELAEAQAAYETQQALKAKLNASRTKAGNMAYYVYQRDALCTDASAYTCNYKESSEGSYEGLIDGNLNTYFHSAYGVASTANHYLQIQADMSAQDAVRFLFRKRYNNHVNRPTDILVQGSTDGETFEDITEITDGLPVTKDENTDPYYCSPALNVSGKNYQYIRFTVKATNNGAADNSSHVFFTFSEFYLLPDNNVTAALSDIFTASWDDADLDDKIAAVDAVEPEIVQFGNYKNISSYLPTATAYKNLIGEGIGHFSGDITEAYNNAKAAGEAAYVNGTDYTSLYNALTAAVNGLTINQPVNGKAYKLIAVYSDGKEQPLYWNGTRITAKNAENIADANTSVFVARVLESGKVVFVNNAGKYLSWCDSGDAGKSQNVNGYTDSYIVQNDWTIEAATNTSNVADAAFAGLYQISALGKNGTDMYYLTPRYEGDDTDAAFIASGALDKWYDAPGSITKLRSYTFKLEEASYANTPALNEAKGIDGIAYIGTFSAPFATVVPAGVEAWYVSEKTATSATMTALAASEAIPANEGVILTGAAAGAVTMLPVTSETVATISGNGLVASAGAAHIAVAGDYVMGLQNELVAFYPATVGTTLAMNKAYLNVGEGGGALAMNFGGNATGLNNAAATETNNAPVFDLSGRRVMHTVKGGLYIQNGKKFIVK